MLAIKDLYATKLLVYTDIEIISENLTFKGRFSSLFIWYHHNMPKLSAILFLIKISLNCVCLFFFLIFSTSFSKANPIIHDSYCLQDLSKSQSEPLLNNSHSDLLSISPEESEHVFESGSELELESESETELELETGLESEPELESGLGLGLESGNDSTDNEFENVNEAEEPINTEGSSELVEAKLQGEDLTDQEWYDFFNSLHKNTAIIDLSYSNYDGRYLEKIIKLKKLNKILLFNTECKITAKQMEFINSNLPNQIEILGAGIISDPSISHTIEPKIANIPEPEINNSSTPATLTTSRRCCLCCIC